MVLLQSREAQAVKGGAAQVAKVAGHRTDLGRKAPFDLGRKTLFEGRIGKELNCFVSKEVLSNNHMVAGLFSKIASGAGAALGSGWDGADPKFSRFASAAWFAADTLPNNKAQDAASTSVKL